MHNVAPIICALDMVEVDRAIKIARSIREKVAMVKVGLEYFTANGIVGVRKVIDVGIPVFLDLKLHDIPNTVAGAVRSIKDLDLSMLTIHISGGKNMIKAVLETLSASSSNILPLGVTVLTSIDDEDFEDIGMNPPVESHVMKLVDLAVCSGLKGIVCSPYEVSAIRNRYGNDITLVVPGIRVASGVDDQKRAKTPREALLDGADYIVIGRPITQSVDPLGAVEEISASIV